MGQGAQLTNQGYDSLPLPGPLSGILAPGQSVVVNASAATLLSYGIPGSGPAGTLRVQDLGSGYTGPYNAAYQGALLSDGTVTGGGHFGNGADGTVVFDGTTTVLGLVPSSTVYTLARDIFVDNMTLAATASIITAGYRVYCRGVATINGVIKWNGNAAVTTTAGAALTAEALGGSFAGGAGHAGGAGSNGSNATTSLGGTGGAGGAGTGGSGAGTGGTVTAPTAAEGGLSALPFATMGQVLGNAGLTLVKGGAGGAGGGDDGTGAGGGGGGGAGFVVVSAWSLQFGSAGIIEALGGAGAAGGATNCGGGGGGGGGIVVAVYHQTNAVAANFSVLGGTPGAGTGTGAVGVAGGAGTLIQIAA